MRFYYLLHASRVADKISTFCSMGTLRISCIVKVNLFVFFLGDNEQLLEIKRKSMPRELSQILAGHYSSLVMNV